MADPAWGTSTLSDEETARALCAFHQTEPLPTQRRRPLQHQQHPQQQQAPPAAPLYRARDERSQEMPQLAPGARAGGGFSAFGYPLSGSYHMVPMSAPRNEAASMLVGMHGPSTSSDDWQRQQQHRIQEELEQQQRELQALTQRQQQQDLQIQLQHLQAQIQQQQQEQAHRQVERIPEPRYSSGLGGFEQTPWSNDAHTSSVSASSFGGGDSGRNQEAAMQRGAQMQQNGRFFDGGFQRAQPVSMRPKATPTGPRSYAYSHEESSQPGMSTNRDDALFAPQQVPQPAQSHFRERNTDIFGASTLQSWGRSESTSLTGMRADRTKSFQMQNEQRFVPQQQQPQPYYPTEPCERKYQDPATRSHARRSVPDIAFLDGVMRHFPTSAETVGDVSTRTARSDEVDVDARSKFEFAPTQYRTQPGLPTQMEVQSRTTVPPTGAVIIPGVSLASPPIRLVTMRDLLNGEEAKADKSRGRPRDNQQRAPQKRKAPKKKTPVKRQRMPQQQNEQRPRQLQMNRSVRGLLPNQNSSLAPSGGPALASKPATPMYLAFMESRAARALEQKSGVARANPSIPQTAQSQLFVSAAQSPAHQTSNRAVNPFAGEAALAKQKRAPHKRKKAGAPPDTRAQEQSVCSVLAQATSKPMVFSNKSPELSQSCFAAIMQKVGDRTQVNCRFHSSSISDDPMDGKFEQRQEPPQLAVDNAPNGKLGKSSRRRRTAKLPQPGLNTQVVRGEQQHVSSALPVPAASAEIVSSAATAAASSSAANPPRVENRTVVIFCKRDFMRYQAAKIWRKYQEQLKKQEEWREVRVAGKRTRYLNSRYDDEFRRTHRKAANKRSSNRPRARAHETNGHEALSSTAAVDSTATTANNGSDEGGSVAQYSGATLGSGSVHSEVLLDACDVHSSGASPDVAGNDILVTLPDSRQERAPSLIVTQIEAEIKCMDGSSVLNEPDNDVADDSAHSKEQPATVRDVILEAAADGAQSKSKIEMASVVADVAPDDKAILSTATVSSNGGVKLAITAPITDTTDADGNTKVTSSRSSESLGSAVAETASSGSMDTIVSSASVSRESTEEGVNNDASCPSEERESQTFPDLKQACTNFSSHGNVKQTCAVAATANIISGGSVETCTNSAAKSIAPPDNPNGVTTNDDGANTAEALRCGANPSSGGTTILAKAVSADLGATNSDKTEIKQCADSPTSDDLNPSKSAYTDPVTTNNGGASV